MAEKSDDARLIEWFDEWFKAQKPYRDRLQKNENYWRARPYENREVKEGRLTPSTPTMFSTVENLLSDIMDAYPQPSLLAQELTDEAVADEMTAVLRSILQRMNYRKLYRKKSRLALKRGTSVQEVYWDAEKYGGLGDVGIRVLDPMQLVYDPLVSDIVDARAVYVYSYMSEEAAAAAFPKYNGGGENVRDVVAGYDERSSVQGVRVVECWYRDFESGEVYKRVFIDEQSVWESDGPVNGAGKFPFVVEPLYELDGELTGLSIIDLLGPVQDQIDDYDRIILENSLFNAKPRFFSQKGAGIDRRQLMDADNQVVDVGGSITEAFREFPSLTLPPATMAQYENKVQMLKDESGQSSFTRGETGGGVTSYSAIAALQEQGSKRSRMINDQMYDHFSDLIRLMLAVIRENYTEERVFRLTNQVAVFRPGMLTVDGQDVEFDVKIEVEKANAFTTMANNEVVLELVRDGVVEPDEALELLILPMKDKLLAKREQAPPPEDGVPPELRGQLEQIDQQITGGSYGS